MSSYVAVTPKLRSLNLSMCFTALLLRVPEVFGCYISLHSARSACRLTALGRTDLMMMMSFICSCRNKIGQVPGAEFGLGVKEACVDIVGVAGGTSAIISDSTVEPLTDSASGPSGCPRNHVLELVCSSIY